MKNEQRPQSETPSSGASRGGQIAHPILEADRQSIYAAIERASALYFDRPGRVVELRALEVQGGSGRPYTASGYFDNPKDFVEAAMRYDGRCVGVYATLNVIDPALLARANNRVADYAKASTGDQGVTRLVRLLVDVDPQRPSGTSSTQQQLGLARTAAREIVDFLTTLGFPEPARGMSGNGAHAIYGVDLPVQDSELIKRCLVALGFRFDDAQVQVDTTVHKPAQLGKVFGTLACKGDALPERPHRRTQLHMPEGGLVVVPREALEKLATLAPAVDAKRAAPAHRTGTAFDVEAFLRNSGLAVAKSGPWNGHQRWVLEACPFDASHTNKSAFVVQFSSGAVDAGCLHASCQHWGWRELRSQFDPGAPVPLQGASGSSVSWSPGALAETWPVPFPLPDALAPVQPFDLELLPPTLRLWVGDIADRIQCPADFPAVAMMIALAGVVGRKVGIRPKRYDDWLVVPNLWGAVIGRPGILKSPAIDEPLKALKRLELAAKKEFEGEQEKFEAQALVAKEQRKAAGRKIKDAIESGDDPLAIAEGAVAGGPDRPVRRRYLVNDSTVEKLGELLNENPNGVTCYRDELVGLLTSLDKEGQEGARSFYLEAWNGTGRYTYDRIGRGTIDIEAAIVSIIGGIQPGPLGAYLHHAVEATRQDDGLIQRFQLAVWPDVSKSWVNVDRWPDSEARRRVYELFERLDRLSPAQVGARTDEHDADGIPFVRFDGDAQLAFDEWRENLERRVRSGAEPAAIESHLAKYRSLAPSLALLFHLADGGVGRVGVGCVRMAIRWCAYLESHARRIYSVAINSDLFAAKALATKIHKGDLSDGFALRDVYRHGWSYLSSRDAAQRAVDFLMDHDWLREVRESTGGAPKLRYFINPRLAELHTAAPDITDETSALDPSGSSGSTCGEAPAPLSASPESWEEYL